MLSLVTGLGLFVGLMVLGLFRSARAATAWGALVGPLFGVWMIAPRVLRAHYLAVDGLQTWLVISAFFVVTFLALGLLLALVSSYGLAGLASLKRSSPTLPVEPFLWTALSLPVTYVLVSAAIQGTFFRQFPSWADLGLTALWLGAFGPILCAGDWTMRHLAGARVDSRRTRVAMMLAATVVGLVVLPIRTVPPRFRSGHTVPALAPAAAKPHAPLLVIGLDGGDWRVLRPLIERGDLPTLSRLVHTGVSGDVHALWPPYWSTPAWGAIVTGYGQDQLGVHEDLGAVAPGLPPFEVPLTLDLASNPAFLAEFALIQAGVIEPAPMSRDQLPRPPVWERLTEAGKRTAVVSFPFTFPARGQATYVVSNRIVPDLWAEFGVKPGSRDELVSPRKKAASLLKWFDNTRGGDASLAATLLPQGAWPMPLDAAVDPVAALRVASDVGVRLFKVTDDIVRRDRQLDVAMMYFGDLDIISHAYYPYRFPEDFPLHPPAAADVAALGPVMDRYLVWFDRQLGNLIGAFPTPPNVIIVSDHGFEAASHVTLWRGWHSPRGVFLAAGPGIAHDATVRDVSYFDIVPTMLDLLDLKPALDLEGHSAVDADPSVLGRTKRVAAEASEGHRGTAR